MNLYESYGAGLRYADFLERYANEGQKQRWRQMHEQVSLDAAQREMLASFRRSMHVLCLAGAGAATASINALSSSTLPPWPR